MASAHRNETTINSNRQPARLEPKLRIGRDTAYHKGHSRSRAARRGVAKWRLSQGTHGMPRGVQVAEAGFSVSGSSARTGVAALPRATGSSSGTGRVLPLPGVALWLERTRLTGPQLAVIARTDGPAAPPFASTRRWESVPSVYWTRHIGLGGSAARSSTRHGAGLGDDALAPR